MKARNLQVHGATVAAPAEDVAVGESPAPPKTGGRRAPRTESTSGGAGGRVLLVVKLFLGLAVVAVASTAVALSLHRYALSTPRFAIRDVSLEGARHLTPDHIRSIAGIELGKNLFSFDTHAAEARLLENPWLREARVVRELPGTLRVSVKERDAYAVAVLGDRPFLVTREGEPFTELRVEEPFDLPVLTGVSTADLARDRKGSIERLKTGADLLAQYARLGIAKVHPAEEVALDRTGRAVLTVGKAGITLELGLYPYARKLAMAERVLAELGAKGQKPGIVFLDNEAHPERVVVRMR